MLRSLYVLKGYILTAEDGDIGTCDDFLFDDVFWIIRYMVADTGKWLPGRKVLISPVSVGEARWEESSIPVRLSKKQIQDSPPLDENQSVCRIYEQELSEYHRWPAYWVGSSKWEGKAHSKPPYLKEQEHRVKLAEEKSRETVLQSANDLVGYRVYASDGNVGQIKDFIFDDNTWAVRYAVVDAGNWLYGRKVLISPSWISGISCKDKSISFDQTVEQIKNSPEFNPSEPVNRQYEMRLYDYYGRPRYWE